MLIRYVDFWPDFDPENFILTKVIEKYLAPNLQIVRDPKKEVDLQISSVFTFSSLTDKIRGKALASRSKSHALDFYSRSVYGYRVNPVSPAKKNIWYTGENKRPPVDLFDGTISFDPTSKATRNIYFPYWMTRINWNLGSSRSEIFPKPEDLMSVRPPREFPLTCCSFASQTEPTRNLIINATSRCMDVTSFGLATGKFVTSKLETSKKYGLQICSENDLYPGYVTEKLQESWFAQNIPIWSGLHVDEMFNEDAYIDVTNQTVESIHEILASKSFDDLRRIQSEPLLNQMPSLNPLIEFIGEFL